MRAWQVGGALIRRDDGLVLVANRRRDQSVDWTPPGGVIDPGETIAESVYDVRIKPGILYQPHPAFATDAQGRYRYHSDHPLTAGELGDRRSPWQFEQQGTRELVAEDYVYAIKRHATTRITTPIYGKLSDLYGRRPIARITNSCGRSLTRRASRCGSPMTGARTPSPQPPRSSGCGCLRTTRGR